MTSGGSGTRISWASTVHRESLTFRTRSIRAPPRPASTTPDRLDQVLQQRRSPLAADSQPRHLFGEGHLRAGRVLAVQTAHGQVDPDWPAAERRIGEVSDIAAVGPVDQDTAPAASRWNTGAGTGLDHHDWTGSISREHQ
uniref:hypothetical protein n=1 Tax=Streptomyces sp. NBC_01001 TaxID=2903713 RepID=UPI002F911DC3